MAANLFIDTNILLSFYHFSSDDLGELNKLAESVEQRKVLLLVPNQVQDEFRRNRHAKIADALRGLRTQKLNFQYPQICKDYDEYARLRELQREYEQNHGRLLDRLLSDAASEQLQADEVVHRLFMHAKSIPTTPGVLANARDRVDLGNPPGKNGSLGDAVNWECLLDAAPVGETLHFVTEDKDYWSTLNPESFHPYLMDEWTEVKECALRAYRRLSDFLREDFPEIKLRGESEKDSLIERLRESPSFQTTHTVVAQLARHRDYTVSQVNAILSAVVDNTQVGWIASDWDVRGLLKQVISGREKDLDQELLAAVLESIGPEPESSDEIPF
ncbi:MAG: PIN domain-containing protein [Coriobacteriia bacterium]|nr:PIN domain-containing protein [Coriobacteriia bacterium]